MTALTNDEKSAIEVAAFKSEQPDRYFAYHTAGARDLLHGDRITTWTGDFLALILEAGRVYRSNFGDRRQSFKARTADGIMYHGIAYLDAGDYVRMRKAVQR